MSGWLVDHLPLPFRRLTQDYGVVYTGSVHCKLPENPEMDCLASL